MRKVRSSARAKGIARVALVTSVVLATAVLLASRRSPAAGDHGADLPPGPIRDRHELMEGVGAAAKKIGAAAKAGKPQDAAAPAEAIAAALERYPAMFPAGSESPLSRAKPNVWTDKAKFDERNAAARTAALALAAAAKEGSDLKAPSGALFKKCKACHEEFREPEED